MQQKKSCFSYIDPSIFKGHQLVLVGKNGACWHSVKSVEVIFTYT